MVALDTKYKNASHHAKSYTVQGTDATIDGLSYQVASSSERYKNSKRIRKALGLSNSNLTESVF